MDISSSSSSQILKSLQQLVNGCQHVEELNKLDQKIQSFFKRKKEEMDGQAHIEKKRKGLDSVQKLDTSLKRKRTEDSLECASTMRTEVTADTVSCAAATTAAVTPVIGVTEDFIINWKLKYYDNLLSQIKKHGEEGFDNLLEDALIAKLPEDFFPYLNQLMMAINQLESTCSSRDNYHSFGVALRALLTKISKLSNSGEIENDSIQRVRESLHLICGNWFTKVNVSKNLKDLVIDLVDRGGKWNTKIDKILQSYLLLSTKIKMSQAALYSALGPTFNKLMGLFYPFSSANSPWRWGRQIFTKSGQQKEFIRIRTCAPIAKGKLSLEYLAFLSDCRAKKQQVVQFVHLDPIEKIGSNEPLWIKKIYEAQEEYGDVLSIVVLPVDNMNDIFSPAPMSIHLFIYRLLAKMLDPKFFVFPQKLGNCENLLTNLIEYILTTYFQNFAEINREEQHAFFGLFYAHLQEKIVFALEDPSIERESIIVINHCADGHCAEGIDRTGVMMGCILAADYYRLGKYTNLEFHSKFLGIVNGPAVVITKRPILKEHMDIIMSVLTHLEKIKNTKFNSFPGEWQLSEFILDEYSEQTHLSEIQ
ncbi:hypothetical protein [Candidatus Protochlamydia sp. R18]|uniref:hypothetical protein n=1 Tax=Candidatus Protochlamydia sp. R18 TaxID=1353977 RepID=UPI0005A8C2CE|nr:hypothetical protein [Candidatus Protochlamydia sp. R18]